MHTATRLLALALLAAPALSAQSIVGRRDRVFTLSERIESGAPIAVFTHSGEIRVTEASGSTLELRAEKDLRGGDVDDIGFVVLRRGGGLTVCAVYDEEDECDERGLDRRSGGWRNWRDRARVNIELAVPRGAVLRVSSGNGAVSVSAAVADATVGSGNGRVPFQASLVACGPRAGTEP